jgi:hypothetical protein
MPQQKKYLATAVLIFTIVIVIFLASGISGVEFQPGTLMTTRQDESTFGPPKLPIFSTPIWYYLLMFAIWVVLPISIVLFIKYPQVRKRTFQGLTYVALYGFVLFLLSRKTQEGSPELEELEKEIVDTTIIETQREASEFISSVAQADQNLNIILDVAILIVIAILIWYVYRRFIYKPPSTTDQLKAEVEGAIDDIEAGADLRNVIIRCYADMSKILNERRGIQRQQAMTPREFELELQEIGLPHASIQRLTRLFEEVRYGNAELGRTAEQEAIHCLSAIAEAC